MKGFENLITDHLSRIVCRGTEAPIFECFSNEQLFVLQSDPWYADIVNYLVTGKFVRVGISMTGIDFNTW